MALALVVILSHGNVSHSSTEGVDGTGTGSHSQS
jgi:hypothetical protein